VNEAHRPQYLCSVLIQPHWCIGNTSVYSHAMPNHHERLRAIAEKVFPTGARLIAPSGEGDYVLLASWKIGTDKARPNKRSKTVRITFSEEAMADYTRATNGEREYANVRFEALLHTRLAKFDPTHDTPLGTEPPVETWIVNTIELNGKGDTITTGKQIRSGPRPRAWLCRASAPLTYPLSLVSWRSCA
jgi:hypothetical protein